MKRKTFLSLLILVSFFSTQAQKSVPIGTKSSPIENEVTLTLTNRIQHYNWNPQNENDKLDNDINSPKSVNILHSKSKYYVNSLEGYETVVYDLKTHKKIKVIKHNFNQTNQYLFKDTLFFNYKFRTVKSNFNVFKGKPVEGCFSHNGKYFWVTYYRRSFDRNAMDPSALCIIDTETDEIVRVMPTGPLPKMIGCSPDNKRIAVTHWGDNTVALIDINHENVNDFNYLVNIPIGNQMKLNFSKDSIVDRDNNCGYCLRGTIFTPDSKHLFIGKMGGASIAVIDTYNQKYIGSIEGPMPNIRHLAINNDELYLSINIGGYVQKGKLSDIQNNVIKRDFKYTKWQNAKVGAGARTISIHPNGKYLFAAVNGESKISIVRTSDMKIIGSCDVDSFPVGMDICDEGKTLIVTSQGKSGKGGGNSVCIYSISLNN